MFAVWTGYAFGYSFFYNVKRGGGKKSSGKGVSFWIWLVFSASPGNCGRTGSLLPVPHVRPARGARRASAGPESFYSGRSHLKQTKKHSQWPKRGYKRQYVGLVLESSLQIIKRNK